jgi:mRNA interferase MazF
VAELTRLHRGGVYLARLDPAKGAEVGKLRPVVLLTAQTVLDADPPVVFICPLSSRSDPAFEALHVALGARDRLLRESYALIEHCRSISRHRIQPERIASLTPGEIGRILHRLQRLVGL